MAAVAGTPSPISTHTFSANLGFEKVVEHREIKIPGMRGEQTYHYFHVILEPGKELKIVMPAGEKMEAMLQILHTFGEQVKGMSQAEYKTNITDNRDIGPIHFGHYDTKKGSLKTTLYKVNAHRDGLIFLVPAKHNQFKKIGKEEQEALAKLAQLIETQVTAAHAGGGGTTITVTPTIT